ncbi:hypothetical protein ACWELJ_21355 [Nocardia sp. NPDC004582]
MEHVGGHTEHFQRAVRQRIQQLRLSLAGVQRAGGPSVPVLTQILRGEWNTPSSKTFEKLDTALQWVEGSAARAHSDGAEPVSASPLDATADAEDEESETREILERILKANPTIRTAARRMADMSEEDVKTFTGLLDMFVSKRKSREGPDD